MNYYLGGYYLILLRPFHDGVAYTCSSCINENIEHSIAEELSSRFNITLNKYGLFDNCPNWKPVVDYMNDEKTKVEDVPWFVVKVKLVTYPAS